MNSLILELQRDAMASQMPITDLLRKAFVVARKLAATDFQSWITKELDGYDTSDDAPKYRIVRGEIRAWNPYHGWIPVMCEDSESHRALTTRSVSQSIGELDSLLINYRAKGKGYLQMSFSPEFEQSIMNEMGASLRPVLHISPSAIQGIVESVRNLVLDWSLKLEERGVVGKDMSFTSTEKEKAQEATRIVIHNFQGILGDVVNSNVSQSMRVDIRENDFESLAEFLKSQGLAVEDVHGLQDAIRADAKPRSLRTLGPRISSWIGKMIEKAATGAWNITTTAAASLLEKALAKYFGIP